MTVRTPDIVLAELKQAYDTYGSWRAVSANSEQFKGIPPGSLCDMHNNQYIIEKWKKKLNCRKTKPRDRRVFNTKDVNSFVATLEKHTSKEFRKELKEKL